MSSPFDRPWPDAITARAVSPGHDQLFFGYPVREDLFAGAGIADILYISLAKNAGTKEQIEIFNRAFSCLPFYTLADPPAHVGLLSRIVSAHPLGSLSASTTAMMTDPWMAGGIAADVEAAKEVHVDAASILAQPTLDAAAALCGSETILFCVCLRLAGLPEVWQAQTVAFWRKLTGIAAEIFATPPGQMRDYPMNKL
jgi:hypothetical protein